MRSRSVAVAMVFCLGAGGAAFWCYEKASKLRTEGKDYEVADGDVLEFRFNV